VHLLRDVLANEVYPAFGCTKPIACAYAAATAAAQLGEPVERLTLKVDAGTYKNGAAVIVPRSGGAKGNLIAAAMGAALARPDAKLLLLQDVTAEILANAQSLIRGGKCRIECAPDETTFHVDVVVAGGRHVARCVLAGGHTNIERLEQDEHLVFQADRGPEGEAGPAYRDVLRRMSVAEVLALRIAYQHASLAGVEQHMLPIPVDPVRQLVLRQHPETLGGVLDNNSDTNA
jgi:L-cysteine desulfidase